MKVVSSLSTAAAVLGAAATIAPVNAWWDNGHMLVGEVASQLMDAMDVASIKTVLTAWEGDFPNTNEISTAAIWPDLVKCKSVSSFCASKSSPSITAMEDWHYIDLPLNVNGAKWGGKEADLDLFNYNLGGSAAEVLEKTVSSFSTTKSVWAANLLLRNFIHIFGDLHQPLHSVAGVSERNPKGDQGGNYYTFQAPCGFSNLHGLWDAAAGMYSVNNWAIDTSAIKPALQANASALIEMLPLANDVLNIDQYKSLSYKDFAAKVVPSSGSLVRQVVLDSYSFATNVVYANIDLTYTGKNVPCPTQAYLDWASLIAQIRIATAGKRLSVFLTQFARQIRVLGLDKM